MIEDFILIEKTKEKKTLILLPIYDTRADRYYILSKTIYTFQKNKLPTLVGHWTGKVGTEQIIKELERYGGAYNYFGVFYKSVTESFLTPPPPSCWEVVPGPGKTIII